MWSNDKVLKFIEDYHGFTCLWDVTCSDYKNRVKRKAALESLATVHEVPVGDIEKKIHNLKSSFYRERMSSMTAEQKLHEKITMVVWTLNAHATVSSDRI